MAVRSLCPPPNRIAAMADYTVKNIKEVEDQAPNFGLSPNLEARFARESLGLAEVGLSYQRLAPNYRMPFGHKQKEQEEVYVLLSGSARLKLDDDVVELKQWDLVRVPKEVTRNFEAGPEGVEILAIGAPNTGLQDAEQLPGWWSD
jgi:mannose-6-phosphate isomerase-like protein (cupin superfamily)